ncbi:MAG TPA: S41 family peptidase, partial [Tissierellaceae bacterium]|nr:S41 family peptidase [Tissierellaceae bacterium]
DHIDKLEIENIILDIRDNPGGYLDQAVYIGSEFIREGPITHIKYKNREGVTYDSYLKEEKYNLALLVNQNSASASEILAAAVKDRSSGVVIGTTTFGKGTVQEVLALERGDGIKLTVAEYFSPNMNKIEGRGVIPTIVVENSFGEDTQLEKAIEFFTIP